MQIAAAQTHVTLMDAQANLRVLHRVVRAEAEAGSVLIVFPECFASGYCFQSREEAMLSAEPVDGAFTESVVESCHNSGCFVVFGMIERSGSDLFNTAVLVGPDGILGSYRKTHLPWLGVDRFVSAGSGPWQVFSAGELRIGMLICYDIGFPEAARALALEGADLVVLPTNWPPGAETMAEYTINTRAMENHIYTLAANRIGTERGFRFIGSSRICAPDGRTLSTADHTSEQVLRAEIDPVESRNKRIVRVPHQHIIDRFADRRPELYQRLCEPHSLPQPEREAVVDSS